MTTYRAIAATETDPQAPITSALMKAFQDNVLAISEADSTAPLALLPTVLLGTLTTTSGTSQTLSGLVLTPFKFVRLVFNNVSTSLTADLTVGGGTVFSGASLGGFHFGIADFCLSPSIFAANIGQNATVARAGTHSLTTASTSISVTTSAGVWDSGSVAVFGVK